MADGSAAPTQPLINGKSHWPLVRFGDVVKLNTDRSADPAAAGIERYVGIEHIEPEDLRIRSWGLVADRTTFTNYFQPGQVLFVKRRAYQRKVAVADFAGVCSGDIYVLESGNPDVLLPDLLPFICQTEGFFQHAVGTSAGSLSPRTNWTHLANYEFALPPLEEQRRIVELLGGLEHLRRSWNEALQAGYQLLKAIRESHFTVITQIYPACQRRIAHISTRITKGESPRWQGFDYRDDGVRFLTSENVLNDCLSLEPQKFVPIQFNDKLARSKLAAGDILVNIVGGSIGRMCMVPDNIDDANINQAVALIRPDIDVVRPKYLLSYLLTPRINHGLCARSVDDYKPNLSLTSISNFPIPVPPIPIQDKHLEQVRCIESSLSSINLRKDKLYDIRQVILSGWFGG